MLLRMNCFGKILGIYFCHAVRYFQGMNRDDRYFAGIDRSARNGSIVQRNMKSVKEICELTGVTRKTLFYYDRIGLLKPTQRVGTQAHKYYDDEAVETLRRIRLCKECGLRLSEIRMIIENENTEEKEVLEESIRRLQETEQQLQFRIFLARLLQITGTAEKTVRLISSMPLADVYRAGMMILSETDLLEQLDYWRKEAEQDPKRISSILQKKETGLICPEGFQVLCLLAKENSSLIKDTDRKQIEEYLDSTWEKQVWSDENTDVLMKHVQKLDHLKKESFDSTAVQKETEAIRKLLHDPSGFRQLALLSQQKGHEDFTVCVLWICYLKYAFSEGGTKI